MANQYVRFLITSALASNCLFAQFNWGSCGGSGGTGKFTQAIKYYAIADVGEIIPGLRNVDISLLAPVDIDIQLYDKSSGKAVINWPDGMLRGPERQSIVYGSTTITWSGYNGDGTGLGHEYITISGTTDRSYLMKVFGYQAGTAAVNYSWAAGPSNGTTCGGGSGSFQQQITKDAIIVVGDIPASLDDVYIALSSTQDIDIQLYDKQSGTAIIAWPNGLLRDGKQQSLNFHGLTITWSGYNGDQIKGREGSEFISLRGRTDRAYTMKVYGYASGFAKVQYSWGKRFTIFASIMGGGPGDLWDDSKQAIATYADMNDLKTLLTNYSLGNSNPTSIFDLGKIAANNSTGGLVAIAYYIAGTGPSRSTINSSGNSTAVMLDVDKYYRQNPNSRVFAAGFSSGGGDAQNLLSKLKNLGVQVQMSAHIDSVEFLSGDARIPSNVRRAIGFYQKDGTWYSKGEDNIKAEDSTSTYTSNTQISKPAGPSDPTKDSNAYHRNMDNDERVWKTVLDYIIAHR